jgi:uncharacterized alkaline shock family protein YloU
MQDIVQALEHLLQPPYPYLVAVAVVLLLLWYLIRHYRYAHKGIVPFKSQGGTIEIAPQTLRGVMQNAANSVEGVERAACRHFTRGRHVGVRVAIHLRANHRLRDVEALIKKRIRATLLDQFGMDTVEPIHIRVTRIVGDPVASVTDEGESAESATDEYLTDEDPRREAEDDRPYSEDTRL